MKRLAKYLLVMLLPLGVLLLRPLTPALVLMLGQEILLETEPFDPRDLFRGDYVELSFSIERVPLNLPGTASSDLFDPDSYEGISPLYVTLEAGEDGVSRPARLTKEAPSEGVYVRGTYDPRYSWDQETLRVDYGNNLRRFYVKENTGLDLEYAAREGDVEAVARVWKGRIVLDSVRKKDK